MDLEEIPCISEELNVEFSTINTVLKNHWRQKLMENVFLAIQLWILTLATLIGKRLVKESSVRSRAHLRITLTQHATYSTFHAGGSSPD